MCQTYKEKTTKKTPSLDTLAQVPTKGIKSLLKRAKSKWYTMGIVGGLLYLNSELHSYYQRAWYCCSLITQRGQELSARYCNTRVCNICNRIRTANMINGYLKQLVGRDLQFVTLTVPNVSGENLKSTIDLMTKEASNMMRVFRERRGIKINGIRKTECTINLYKNNYHPHFHFVVDGYGQEIVDAWLKRWPTAVRSAQDVRPANQESLNELFKYTTKIIGQKNGEYIVYTKALDTIMKALAKKRCFQPFGDIRKVSEEVEDDLQAQVYEIEEYGLMHWEWKECDWVNKDKFTLTGYISPDVDFRYV